MSFANYLQSKSWQSAKRKNVQVFMGFANIEGCNVNELGVANMLSQICQLEKFSHFSHYDDLISHADTIFYFQRRIFGYQMSVLL